MNIDGGCVSDTALLMVLFDMAAVLAISLWLVFPKAGKPGWAALIPLYNIAVLLEITGRPLWWLFLMLIPFVNLAVFVLVNVDLARSFGKSWRFGYGLTFLSIVFFPILAFGPDRYLGPMPVGSEISQKS